MRTARTDRPSSRNTPFDLPTSVGGPLGTDERTFWVLYGHLSLASISHWKPGDTFDRGAVLAALGDEDENGGWAPHVHVQLSWEAPSTATCLAWFGPKTVWRPWRSTPIRG